MMEESLEEKAALQERPSQMQAGMARGLRAGVARHCLVLLAPKMLGPSRGLINAGQALQ